MDKKRAFQAKIGGKNTKKPNHVCQMIKKCVQKFLQKWLLFCDFSTRYNLVAIVGFRGGIGGVWLFRGV
jgi:hypothetical protein